MALVAKVNTVTVPTGRIRLHDAENDGIGGLTGSADGTGSQGQIVFDDPDHTLALQGFDFVTVDETDCTDAPRLFTGYLADRTTSRGKYPTDGGRQIDATINDPNTLLTWLLIGADGKRPAETRAARIAWLMGSDWWPPNVFDVGWIVPGSHDFEEADYRRQYASDVLSDILETYQTFFVRYDQDSEQLGLFYGAANSSLVASPLSISNDPDDILFDSYDDDLSAITVFPPLIDASSVQDPSSVFSLVDLSYTGGDLRQEDTGTTAQFFSTVGPRGVAIDESRIGKATTAQNFVNSYLAQDADEDETVTCSLILPSYKVGLIDAGDRISAKFVHLDGYEDFKDTRVKSRTLRTVEGRRDLYLMTLELNDRGPFGKGGGGGGGSNPPPTTFPPGESTPSVVQTGCGHALGAQAPLLFDNPVSVGHIVVVGVVWRDGVTDLNADIDPGASHTTVPFTQITRTTIHGISTQETCFAYRVVTSADLAYGGRTYYFGSGAGSGRPKIIAWELAGVAAPNASVSVTNHTGALTFPSLAISGTGIAIGVVGAGVDCAASYTTSPASDHYYIENGDSFFKIVLGNDALFTSPTSVAYAANGVACGGAGGDDSNDGGVAFFPSAVAATPPAPGQQNNRPEIATMTGANGTTLWPFADGTLKVIYDTVDQTAAIVSYDGAAGTFVMPSAPPLGTQVFVEYKGR
jgi:hypothetical protein